MALIYNDAVIEANLNTGTVHRTFMHKTLARGDKDAYRFIVKCIRDGQVVNISGSTVVGLFIRPDGNTVLLSGAIASNTQAVVVLKEACCAYAGNFSLAIKILSDNRTATMVIVDGTIVDVYPGSTVDPGGVFPSTSTIQALIDQAEADIATLQGLSVQAVLVTGDKYSIVVTT